jgi:glycine/D-amino acid oxidase-like deaminating enzyme
VTDVIVIGGGIVGCAAAMFLAEAGAGVLVLEADAIACAASGRNAGSIQHPLDPARAELYDESVAIHRRFGVIGERPAGFLAVGTHTAMDVALDTAARFPALRPEVVTGAALRELEPELADGWAGCLLPGTGFPAHPAAATRRFADVARAFGARIEEGRRAAPEFVGGRCVGARGDDGVLHTAGAVLVAAGPWSSELIGPAGASRPVSALWGVTVQIALPPGHVIHHRIEEWDDSGTDAELRPHIHFEVTPLDTMSVLGASRATTHPDRARVAAVLVEHATRFLPAVASSSVIASRVGARPGTADALPLLGPVPDVEGLFVAAGHGPYGISLGPGSGRIAADAVLGKAEVPAAFRVDRVTPVRPLTSPA